MQFFYGDDNVPSREGKGHFFFKLKCIYAGNVYGKAGVSRNDIKSKCLTMKILIIYLKSNNLNWNSSHTGGLIYEI